MPMLQHGRAPRPHKLEPPIIAGRVPPHDLDAEAAVLSAIMLDRDALDRVLEILKPDHFYSDANGRIYEAAQQLAMASMPIDITTVAGWLRDRERLPQIGGAAYLGQLADATPAVSHVGAHARIVYEKWRVRQLIAQCQRISAEGYGDVGVVQEFIDGAEQAVYELARTPESTSTQPIAQVLKAAFEQISKATERGDRITGISTGYEKLDAKTAGLHDGDLTIVAARPGMGKCVAADSEILLDDGSVVTIAEVFRRQRARLLTLGADYRFRITEPSHFVDDGHKPVFRVTTRLGRRVETTITHPFLTEGGWRPLAEVKPGDRVGVPRALPVFGTASLRDCEVKLLAYSIADGGLQATPSLVERSPRVVDDFFEAVHAFGRVAARSAMDVGSSGRQRPVLRSNHQRMPAARAVSLRSSADGCALAGVASGATPATLLRGRGESSANGAASDPVVEWLLQQGPWGEGTREQFVPAPVFQLPRPQLALFLNRLFAASGSAAVLDGGGGEIAYGTCSERVARQVQHLLLRFGALAALHAPSTEGANARWRLVITDARSIRRFCCEIGLYGKEAALWAVDEAVGGERTSERGALPSDLWRRLITGRTGARPASSTHTEATRPSVRAVRSAPSPTGAVSTADVEAREVARLAQDALYWDEVVSIEALGLKQVYDLTIPETHNFVADDVCVHNTSFVMNLAVNVASPRTVAAPGPGEDGHGGLDRQEAGHGVVVFSLEMPREQLATRMVCSEGRVDLGKLRQGYLQPEDWRRLTEAASYLSSLPVWIDDTPAEYQRIGRIGLVIIDYLQLMKGRDGVNSREQEISEISRGLKQLAKELRVPVIALSQLNRAVETRTSKDKRPQLSDLRESGAIEQDADTIIFIYRDDYYNPETTNVKGIAELIIAKQRNGPTGKVLTRFTASCTRFDNLAPGDYPDMADDE
jgi:replicative DNA helicase